MPDFADGFDFDGNEGSGASTNFVQIILELKEPILLTNATVKFHYSASDPNDITKTGSDTNGWGYTAAEGTLRIWTKDGPEERKKASISSGGDYVKPDAEYTTNSFPQAISSRTWKFYVEGIGGSANLADEQIRVVVDPDGPGDLLPICGDAVRLTVVKVDLDIDSNNKDGLERSDVEDAIEDIEGDVTKPGKVVFINTGDTDGDGVPDFADGIDLFDNEGTEASAAFTPITVELSEAVDLSVARLRFTYDASNPADVDRTGDDPTNYVYTAAAGHLRIWTKDGPEDRLVDEVNAGGDYVAPDTEYIAEDLGSANVINLYLEGIDISDEVADQRIKVELDPDGDGPADYLSTDAVRVTLVGYRLVQPDQDNNTTPVTDIKNSHPSPVVTLPTVIISNVRPGPSGTNLIADIEIEGTLTSAVCDYTPGSDGMIDDVKVFVNDYKTPTVILNTTATKGSDAQSFLKPYPFSATFGDALQGVEVQPGVNVVRVEATDKVFEIAGYAEMSVVIETTPAWSIGQSYTDYSISLDFDGAQSLADITAGTPITLTFTNHLQTTNNVYQSTVFKSSSSPLTFTNAEATVVIADTSQLNTALATNVLGTAQAFISIPLLAPVNILFSLSETAADSSVFLNASFQFQLAFSGGLQTNAVDTVTAKIRKSGGSWTQATLTETGENTLVFEDAQTGFAVTLTGAPDFGTNTVEGLEVIVSHDALNVDSQEIVLLETGLDSQEFDHDNSIKYDDSAFGPSAWNYSVQEAELVAVSDGGEFHPYMLQLLGPSELLAELDHIETADGNRNVVQAFDGNWYMSMANAPPSSASPAVLVSNAGDTDFADFVFGELTCTYHKVRGFYAGASSLKEGVATITMFLLEEQLLRLNPVAIPWVMINGDKFEKEWVFIRHNWETLKQLDAILTALQTAFQQDVEEVIWAALHGDLDEIKRVSGPYQQGFEYSVEVLGKFWDELLSLQLTEEEICYWSGRAGFEIIALIIPYSKLSNASKLGYINELKTTRLYGESAAFKTAVDDVAANLDTWLANATSREYDRFFSAYARARKTKGPKEAFEDGLLADSKKKLKGKPLKEVSERFQDDAIDAAVAAGYDPDKLLTVKRWNELITSRKGLGENYTTSTGKSSPDFINIHHVVDQALQKEIGLTAKGIDLDSCPGFLTTTAEHIPGSANPKAIHTVFADVRQQLTAAGVLPEQSVRTLNTAELKILLKEGWKDPRLDRANLGEIAAKWVDDICAALAASGKPCP